MAKTCTTDGCEKANYAHGLCSAHHYVHLKANAAPCTTDGCEKAGISRGMCTRHYQEQLTANAAPCRADGCDSGAKARGMCRKHYHEWRKTTTCCTVDGCDIHIHGNGLCAQHFYAHQKANAAPCTESYCDRDGIKAGMCNRHYRAQWQKNAAPCTTDGCEKAGKARGMCDRHYRQLARAGELPLTKPVLTPEQRIEVIRSRSTVTESGCWEWPKLNSGRYPSNITLNGRITSAHRAALEAKLDRQLTRAEPAHHACANRACVNPEHLQAVTAAENNAEMLERTSYERQIAELQAQLAALQAA